MAEIQLGLGLLSIGRQWGVGNVPPPAQSAATDLLAHAVASGIRFFDTAPAYGASEAILGRFLTNRDDARRSLTIATKMGEFWQEKTKSTTVSHDYDDLVASIESSLAHLGTIDLMQVHKATSENLASADVLAALDYAEKKGISSFGASVSDLHAAITACKSARYSYVQCPYNQENTLFEDAIDCAEKYAVKFVINRPLAMGKLATGGTAAEAAFRFILKKNFKGWVLTGTSSKTHLTQNLAAFDAAKAQSV